MIFISYSSKNRETALAVREALMAEGMDVWMDQSSIPGGDYFAEPILDAIEACSVFVLLLSRESQESRNVRDEFETAYSHDKPILPVHIDNSEIGRVYMFRLTSFQIIEAKGVLGTSFDLLVARCKALENVEKDFSRAKKPASSQDGGSLLTRIFGGAKKKPAAPAKAKPSVAAASATQQTVVDRTKEIDALAQKILDLESIFKRMSADSLALQTDRLRNRLAGGESLDDLMPEAIATARCVAQLMLQTAVNDDAVKAAVGLYKGMAVNTHVGDNRSIPIAMAAYVYALDRSSVHVACGLEAGAQKYMDDASRLLGPLGVSCALVRRKASADQQREAYKADVVYGSYATLTLDYLYDNMTTSPSQRRQRGRTIAFIDDVDRILVDLGRTPCSILGKSSEDLSMCKVYDYFRMYDLLAGISETAAEAAEELRGIYRLQPYIVGHDKNLFEVGDDEAYATSNGRWEAVARKVADAGCPVVIEVGRPTYAKDAEALESALAYVGIRKDKPIYVDGKELEHDLNAFKILGTNLVTVIVDDVQLVGKPWSQPSELRVISTVRHEDNRLDHRFENFIASRFSKAFESKRISFTYMLSFDDPLIADSIGDRADKIRGMLLKVGFSEDEPIEGSYLTRAIGESQIYIERACRMRLKRQIQLENPINWQQLNMYDRRDQILDRIEVHENAIAMVGSFARSLVDEACPEGASRADWQLAKLNTELAMLGDFGQIPQVRNAETREELLEMVRLWLERVLESKLQSLDFSEDKADDLLGKAMLKCIDQSWPKYRKRATDMLGAVKWPNMDNDAAWKRTIDSFKAQIDEEYDGLQRELSRSFFATVLGVRKK